MVLASPISWRTVPHSSAAETAGVGSRGELSFFQPDDFRRDAIFPGDLLYARKSVAYLCSSTEDRLSNSAMLGRFVVLITAASVSTFSLEWNS